ncbi:MAG: DUF4038 domain-containing protein [Saprospiraceae bacterium]|nr:DUF4038 domain-containing protein [Saprospiraceae bacterium]
MSENQRYLVKQDGTPFFYLGDTAWELFHRLTLSEASRYLQNRAEKGFTVIQAVILAQAGGLTVANANGDLPLVEGDLLKPNEAYFKHVDEIVESANSLGLVVGMLPTWGSYWSSINGDESIFTPETARFFGEFLGKRYRDKSLIWILGGDENITTDEEREIVEAMAQGIEAGDGGVHLMTFHPRGPGRSSDYFHTAEWLDFNMYQSSHAAHDHDNGLYAEHDHRLTPKKPTLDGEPRYELIPAGFYFQGASRLDLFDDFDCRQAAYWSILAGACGHTYGHNSIWQMWDSSRTPMIGAVVPWYEALDHPGSFHMRYLKELFTARPFEQLTPNQSIILDGPEFGGAKIRAALAQDASFAIIYSPKGEKFTVDQSVIEAQDLKSIWYDPRYGISHIIHSGNTFGIQTYTPPTSGRGNDWILILEDADKKFELP